MQTLPRAARWYLYAIWASAIVLVGYALVQAHTASPPVWLLVGVLATFVLADYFYVPFSVNSREKVSMTVVDALTIFLVSIAGAYGVLVPFVGSIFSDLLSKRPWFKGLFNAAQRSLSYLALVAIYSWLQPGDAQPFSGPRGLLAFVLIALTYNALNTLFVATIVALSSAQPLPKIYAASFRQVHWVHFITLPFGAVLAFIWATNPWLLLPAALPLLMAQRSFQAMAEVQQQAERNEALAQQATALLEELQAKQSELVRSSQLAALGTFSAGIAHEFNNLLAAILGYAQLALTTDDPREKDEALDVAIGACLRGRSITSGLLTFARRRDPQREPCQLEALVGETITLMRPELAKRNVRIAQRLEPVPLVVCDAGQISQVLINLLTNARDAMESGGEILVTLRLREGAVELAVRDTGSGIPAELIEQIFQPFMTTKGALSGSTTPGTGLGLAISHGIIEAHGGSIAVQSTPGRGTIMTVRLPLDARAGALPEPTREPAALDPLRILVIDDEGAIGEWLRAGLARDMHSVVVATDGESGLRRFNERPFDLVICDVTLPGMGGDELTRRIRAIHPDVQILGITGQPGSVQAERMLAFGALAVLSKPFTYEDLRRTLEQRMLLALRR